LVLQGCGIGTGEQRIRVHVPAEEQEFVRDFPAADIEVRVEADEVHVRAAAIRQIRIAAFAAGIRG